MGEYLPRVSRSRGEERSDEANNPGKSVIRVKLFSKVGRFTRRQQRTEHVVHEVRVGFNNIKMSISLLILCLSVRKSKLSFTISPSLSPIRTKGWFRFLDPNTLRQDHDDENEH